MGREDREKIRRALAQPPYFRRWAGDVNDGISGGMEWSSTTSTTTTTTTTSTTTTTTAPPSWASYFSYIPTGGSHWYIRQNNPVFGTWHVGEAAYYNTQNYENCYLETDASPPDATPGWWTGLRPTKIKVEFTTNTGMYLRDIQIFNRVGQSILYDTFQNILSDIEYNLSIAWTSFGDYRDDIWRLQLHFSQVLQQANNNFVRNIQLFG